MAPSRFLSTAFKILATTTVLAAIITGVILGVVLASTRNIQSVENYTEFDPALPSRILDSQGRLITEFASDEKREIISIKDMPQHLVDALITREDQSFWTHPGFSFRDYMRAFIGFSR